MNCSLRSCGRTIEQNQQEARLEGEPRHTWCMPDSEFKKPRKKRKKT